VSKKLVPRSGTYLFSMQGIACREWKLGGFFLYGKGCQAAKDIWKELLG
jgi:hypothetical protein